MADLQETMGTSIRRARRERRLTLRELADRSALSLVYLGEIERGKKYPSARVLEELARALDMDISDLLDLVAQELRATVAPVLAPQPAGITRSNVRATGPRAALGPRMAVASPPEVALIAVMGSAFGPGLLNANPQQHSQPVLLLPAGCPH
jgi:transcriptional regulator with XRE-family HTH domain